MANEGEEPARNETTGIRRHYHVIVAACCFLVLFVNVGMPSTAFSVYQSYIVEIPGVGHFGGSMVLAARTLASLLAMFFVVYYYRRFSARTGVLIANIAVCAGFCVYSVANDVAGFCVGAFITGAGYGLGGMVATTMLIRRWFATHVGTVAGFVAVGTGVCAMIVPPTAVRVIEATSLSTAFAIEGAAALVIGLAVFAVLRNCPEDLGLKPYGAAEGGAGAAEAAGNGSARGADGERGAGRADARGAGGKRGARYDMPHVLVPLAFAIMMCIGAVSIVGAGYVGVLFTSEGFSNQEAARLIVVFSVSLTAAKLCNGVVFDKLGTRNGSMAFFALLIAGLALLCATDLGATRLAAGACVLAGAGVALGTVGISVWSIELAPRGHVMQNIKNYQLGYVLGGFMFNFVPGALMEAMGTYLITYELLLGMAVFACAALLGIYLFLERRAS